MTSISLKIIGTIPTQENKSGSVWNSRKPTSVADGISQYVKCATLFANAQDIATIMSFWRNPIVIDRLIINSSVFLGTVQKKRTNRLDIKKATNAPQTATIIS